MEYKYFKPSIQVNDLIKSNDEMALISILVGIINRDPTFETTRYDEAEQYISSKIGKSLKSEYKALPGEYSISEEKWDKEYYRMLLVWLSDNYCDERLEQVRQVGKIVYERESTWGKQETANFVVPTTRKMKERRTNVVGLILMVLVAIIVIVRIYFKI